MSILNSVIARDADIAWRMIEGDVIAVNPKNSIIYPLDEVASRIWGLLDGKNTCADIALIIGQEFDGDKIRIEKDVVSFIEELIAAGLAKKPA